MYGNDQRPMKRAHSPDFETPNYNRGPYRGPPGGGQWNQKRQRGEAYNQPQTVEERIVRLGDTGSRNYDIGQLAKLVESELLNKAVEEEKTKSITTQICKCIISFPTRVSTYATLIGLISVKHYNVSCQVINTLHASYPVYLEAQKWQEALTIIHLLANLVNCKVIRPSALVSQFELMLEVALEENVPQTRSDYFVYTVLSSLTYVAQELASQPEPAAFEQILATIETYLARRSKSHLNLTRVWISSDSTVQMDYLDSLWVQMKNFKANGWNEVFLPRPYNDKEFKDIMASSLIPQNSPTIQIPAHKDDYAYPPPRVVFRVFEDDVIEGPRSIPGSDKIERFCIENRIRSIIDEIPKDPRDCARHLGQMYRSDQLSMEHMLIETILGEIFTLPKPRHQPIVYHAILYEFTKIFPTSRNPEEIKFNYDSIMNEAVKVLYENLDTMNITCFSRFVEWFSFHLNNTKFLFPWQSWSDAASKGTNTPKAMFVQDILDHCVRFSFHKKIEVLVANSLASLMPPEVGVHYKPVHHDNPSTEELAATIKKLIIDKADAKSICETLNITIEGVEMPEDFVLKEEKHIIKLLKVDVFTAVILSIASKSLTHLSSAIGKYRNVLKALTRVEDGQVQLLQTMHSCLETHPQLQVILVDKLLKADLVEAKEVCNWVFSDPMKPHHLKSYPWELLNNTAVRTLRAAQKLEKEREKAVETSKGANEDEDEAGDVDMVKGETVELDGKVEKARETYLELMLQIFRMFADLLGEHIRKCEISSKSYMDDWFRWLTGRMQEVYFNHYDSVQDKYNEIKSIIDGTPSIGSSIINLNKQHGE